MYKRWMWTDKLMLPAVLAAFTIIMTITSPVYLLSGVSFFLFQMLGILLPGRALLEILGLRSDRMEISSLEQTAWSYAAGYALNIVEYYMLAPWRGLWLLRPACILISIGSAVYLVWKWRASAKETPGKYGSCGREWIIILIFFIIVLTLRYITYYGLNLLPGENQAVNFRTQDLLFYIGNGISASRGGWPIAEFRYAGMPFYYHYFGSVQLAVMNLVTGIDFLHLEFCFAWVQGTILVITLFWCFLGRLQAGHFRKTLGLFLLLFTTGKELIVYVAFQHKMYTAPFGWDIGMAFGIFFLTMLLIQWRSTKFHCGLWLMTLLTLAVCEGSKAPIAVIYMVIAGCCCGAWLFMGWKEHEKWKWALLYGSSLLLIFAVVFFGIVSQGWNTVTTNASGLHISLTGHLYECGLGRIYFDLTAAGMPGIFGKLLIILMFFYGCNMAVYFLLTVECIHLLRKKEDRDLFRIFMILGGVACGLLLTLLTKQTGNSQMYFAMAAFPVAIAAAVCYRLPDRGHFVLKWSVCGLFAILVAWSFVSFVQIVQPSIDSAVAKLSGVSDFDGEESNSLTSEELEGYTWVRENADKDACFVTNVVLDDTQYQSFVVGVCTERQMYMEGWRYVTGVMEEQTVMERRQLVTDFFAGNPEAAEALRQDGVDYVLWTDRYGSLPQNVEEMFGDKVYDNGAIRVYRIKNT